MERTVDLKNRDEFIKIVNDASKENSNYINVIQCLDKNASTRGTAWLQSIVDHVTSAALSHLPSYGS